jgi:phenylacetate-CoA ligase
MVGTFRMTLGLLAEARRNRRRTRAELDAAKLVKFRALVRHAKAHSPYYHDIIAERGLDIDTCTPADFPLLTKTILMENFDRIVTDPAITRRAVADFLTRSHDPNERFLKQYTVMHTSGTSGEVGYFLYSRTDWLRMRMSGMGRGKRGPMGFRWPGLRRIRLAFYGATGGHYAGVTSISAMDKGWARLIMKVGIFEINEPLPQTIAQLNAFQPDVLSGYTAALRMLGDKQKEGVLKIAPSSIGATGETVTRADMTALSDAFGGASVVSAYGCTEHLMLGSSNPGGETMTLNDNELIFEFHEDHSVITNLLNFTMPLIRYRMSDILRPVSGPGDRDMVIEALVGRTERTPTFINRNGVSDFISPHTINEVFVAGVTRFQMQLTGEASFRFPVCLQAGIDAAGRASAVEGVRARLTEILVQKAMGNVAFEIPVVDDLPLNPKTRKFQLIVDEREPL